MVPDGDIHTMAYKKLYMVYRTGPFSMTLNNP